MSCPSLGLIGARTWKLANEALDSSERKRRGANAQNAAMLKGAIFCPDCQDSPMYKIISGRNTSRGAYYRCSGKGRPQGALGTWSSWTKPMRPSARSC